ncbi:hypothetical protein [Ruminococcus flavefaciens]|uniref:Uncharacterized protein n=1 Tax=Ruminococcus flavefaciens 007c TaxID=1341157 RepID=W7UP11_RUMFL|nr:hypothetical protein [Ruminococcus flavefaciens]EWM53214.1 hypothetical protein RF007C_09555 [Ruminococcus flavefaciens 007c]
MSDPKYWGYKGYILQNNGEILYDGGQYSIAHFSNPEDTRYYVECKFPVPVGLRDTSCPAMWTSDDAVADELISDPEKVFAWIREQIKDSPRYVGQPFLDIDVSPEALQKRLRCQGGDPKVLATNPKYFIYKCYWPASEEYWLASDTVSGSPFDSAPMWSCDLTKEQAEFFVANPGKIGPFYAKMIEKYPLGH